MTKYVRYQIAGSAPAYGILDGDTIKQLTGDPIKGAQPTGAVHQLAAAKLLHPVEPGKILAVGRNYRSHLNGRPEPPTPEIFYKPISCLQDPEGPIVIPSDATDLHYEGELVLVIGKRARNVSLEDAQSYLFGVTCGNDISERQWQGGPNKDLQWWRAKGCDTFGPLGPVLVTGVNYDNLLLQTRMNGEVVQKQYTSDLIFNTSTIVSWISRYLTLEPGDIIYTGTPGTSKAMKPGDIMEVELENVGILRNPVVAE